MGLILWVVFGGIVGYLATIIMGTNSQSGIIMNIVIGIVGAVIGGAAMSTIGETAITGFNLYSFLVALVGAVGFIALLGAINKQA